MKIFSKQKNKAFTLVETLVAITIFTVALVALMNVLGQGLSNTTYSRQKLTATYLAQEGIEYMRNIRDTYMLYSTSASVGWNLFNAEMGTCKGAHGCYFDDRALQYNVPTNPTIIGISINPCGSSTCAENPLLYDPTSGKYGYTTGTTSGFSRKIQVNTISVNNPGDLQITSTVYWLEGSTTQSVSFSEDLFDWIQ